VSPLIRAATRTVLALALATAVSTGICLTPAAAVTTGTIGTISTTATTGTGPVRSGGPAPALTLASYAGSAETAVLDLPDAPVRDDYPWQQYATNYLGGDTVTARQCSAFALWRIDYRLQLATNTTLIRLILAFRMTGAKDLDNAAVRAGYGVDRTPAVGALAQWEAGAWGAGSYGHVAFVARVYADGTILLEEYNALRPLAYNTRRINAHSVSHYLHLAR
jgi:surface antigen